MEIGLMKGANSVNKSKLHPWIYRALVVGLAASTKTDLIMIKRTTSS
jgi:hypothetical protein